MSSANKEIVIKLRLEDKEIEAKLLNVDQIIDTISDATKTATSNFASWGNITTGLNQGLMLFERVWSKLSIPVNVSAEFERYNIQFEVLLGNADKATKLLDEIREFGASTPLEFTGLVKNAQLLLNFGIEADKVLPILKNLGDISGGNAQKLDSLTLAFAQSMSAGRLMGQDLLQMINAGFNPLQVIAEKTGKSIGELKKQMEEGAISSQMVADAFEAAASEGGRFHGMMERQAESYEGMKSNLSDAATIMLKSWGDELLPTVKSVVGNLTDFAKVLTISTSNLDKANQKIREERYEFELLTRQYEMLTQKTELNNLEKQRYSEIITQLNSKYGEYLGNIDLERASWIEVTTAINSAREALMERAKVMVIEARLKDYLDQIVSVQSKIINNELQIAELEAKQIERRESLGRPGNIPILGEENSDAILFKLKSNIDTLKSSNKEWQSELDQIAQESLEFGERYAEILNNILNPTENNSGSTAGQQKGLPQNVKDQIHLNAVELEELIRVEMNKLRQNIESDGFDIILPDIDLSYLKTYYDSVKYEDENYYAYRKGLIEDEIESLRNTSLTEIEINRYKNQRMKELDEDYFNWKWEQYQEDNQLITGSMDAMWAGYDTFFSSLTNESMSFAERLQSVWESIEGAFIGMLANMLKEYLQSQIQQALIAGPLQKASIAQAGITGEAIASAYAPAAALASIATFGGANIAAILGLTSTVAFAKMLALGGGFEEGGLLPKGKAGFVEGYHNEIIAPEKTFIEVFRNELKPKIYENVSLSSGAASQSQLLKEVESLNREVRSLNNSMKEFALSAKAFGDDEIERLDIKARYLNNRGVY
jgi:tape measure domain-containing protein